MLYPRGLKMFAGPEFSVTFAIFCVPIPVNSVSQSKGQLSPIYS